MDEAAARVAVANTMQRLYARYLTTLSGGNVSCRLGPDRVVITPSGHAKNRIGPEQVAVLDLHGRNLTLEATPSSEAPMHLAIYRACHGVAAIAHAHPLVATAFACTDARIERELISETYALLDEPVTVPYSRSGTEELAAATAEAAKRSSVLLLANHGVVATGTCLEEAFSRLELLEEAARLTLVVRLLGGGRMLTDDQKAALDVLVGRAPAA